MPTQRTKRVTTKGTTKPATKPVKKLTAKQTKQAEQHLAACRRLSDLSTVKHPRGSHEANFELFEARQALIKSYGGRWTYKEAGDVLLMAKLVQKGKFSDFPGLNQQEGIASTYTLMEQQLAARERQSEQL